MSHNKLANHVRKAKRKVYASLLAEIRTLHAAIREGLITLPPNTLLSTLDQ